MTRRGSATRYRAWAPTSSSIEFRALGVEQVEIGIHAAFIAIGGQSDGQAGGHRGTTRSLRLLPQSLNPDQSVFDLSQCREHRLLVLPHGGLGPGALGGYLLM